MANGIDDDDAQHREMRIAEPVRRLFARENAGGNHAPVDHAVERIEHPLPGDRGERDRYRKGQDDQRAHDLAAGDRPQQQEGPEFSEHETEQLRAECEDEGVAQGVEEGRVLQDLIEIVQTDELPGRIVDRIGAERVVDREQQRQADEQQHIEDRRRDQDRFKHAAAVKDEVKARNRSGDRFLGNGFRDDGHR